MQHIPPALAAFLALAAPSAAQWTTDSLSEARSRLAATSVGSYVLFGGGRTPSGESAVVDVYDVATGTWSTASLSTPKDEMAAASAGGGSQGTICLSGNIGRYNRASEIVQGPVGMLVLDLTSMPVNPPLAAAPGETWNFQCWHRDANPTTTSNTTNALAVTFATTGVPSVQFAVTQGSLVEDPTQVEVRLTLSQPAEQDVLVTYAAGGTATVDVDWRVEEPNPLVIPAGQTVADMTLVIAGDGVQEPDEVAIVSLAAPVGAVLGTLTTFTLTIVDDD